MSRAPSAAIPKPWRTALQGSDGANRLHGLMELDEIVVHDGVWIDVFMHDIPWTRRRCMPMLPPS
jgi:hypothetical protein